MKKGVARNFVVEIKKRRGRKVKIGNSNLVARALEKLKAPASLPLAQ
jgi:hypothetical protein